MQNLLVTRFANGISSPLEPQLYPPHRDHRRRKYRGREAGATTTIPGRCAIWCKITLLQVVAHVAMEPPTTADAASIRNEKLKLFQSIRPHRRIRSRKYSIRGQYIGASIEGERRRDTGRKKASDKESTTETFMWLKFLSTTGVGRTCPFTSAPASGCRPKPRDCRLLQIAAHHLFRSELDLMNMNNQLIIRVQPDEGILLKFGIKSAQRRPKVKNVGMVTIPT